MFRHPPAARAAVTTRETPWTIRSRSVAPSPPTWRRTIRPLPPIRSATRGVQRDRRVRCRDHGVRVDDGCLLRGVPRCRFQPLTDEVLPSLLVRRWVRCRTLLPWARDAPIRVADDAMAAGTCPRVTPWRLVARRPCDHRGAHSPCGPMADADVAIRWRFALRFAGYRLPPRASRRSRSGLRSSRGALPSRRASPRGRPSRAASPLRGGRAVACSFLDGFRRCRRRGGGRRRRRTEPLQHPRQPSMARRGRHRRRLGRQRGARRYDRCRLRRRDALDHRFLPRLLRLFLASA